MQRILACLACLIALTFSASAQNQKPAASKGEYVPVTKYVPSRDAEKDIQDAVNEAKRTGKRVLLDVGGEWCVWCHILDRFFDDNPKLMAFRDQNFIMTKINFSPQNENKEVLSRYGEIPGFPHLFVLDSDGKLLHSQGTAELEKGKSYDLEKFFSFLKKWAPPSRS
jgi:thiol:disulfide interchange protein